jgi:hypothetical protein
MNLGLLIQSIKQNKCDHLNLIDTKPVRVIDVCVHNWKTVMKILGVQNLLKSLAACKACLFTR